MAEIAVALKALKSSVEGQQFHITKSLGLEREKIAYDSRLKALTKPQEYAEEREAKWKTMLEDISAYFQKTIAYLEEAGFGWDDAKGQATTLSKQFAAIERQKLELLFPTGANVIGTQRQVNLAYNAAGSFNPAELSAAADHVTPIKAARKARKKKS
jgi:hypothetical protein